MVNRTHSLYLVAVAVHPSLGIRAKPPFTPPVVIVLNNGQEVARGEGCVSILVMTDDPHTISVAVAQDPKSQERSPEALD